MSTFNSGIKWPAWGVYVGIILATIISAELFVRIYDWSPRSRDLVAGDNLGMARYNDPSGGFGDLVPGQNGHWNTWFHRPYHVQTNSVGLRNTEEPSDKALRILAIGDSQTFGPFLANEDTWPAWTENYLRHRQPAGEGPQVFNAGIVGYTIVDELAYLKDKAVAFKPNLVILGVFENDLRDLRKDKGGVRKRPRYVIGFVNWLRTLLRNSALMQLANQIKTETRLRGGGVDVRAGTGQGATGWTPPSPEDAALAKRFTDYFQETVALLSSHAIKFAVIFIPSASCIDPHRLSATEPVIRAAAKAAGTPYLDLTAIFQARRDAVSRLYLLKTEPTGKLTGDGHLSREGHAVIGEVLAEWIAKM